MKEELVKLRDLTNEYSQAKDEFERRKKLFDLQVENTLVIFPEQGELASYEVACTFYERYGLVKEYAQKIKKEHPRYGEKRFKETLMSMIENTEGYENLNIVINSMVDAHLDFEKYGFDEVRALEAKVNEAAGRLAETVSDVKEDKIDTAVRKVNNVVDSIKPYGERAKGAINKGARTLIKILENSKNNKDGK